MVIKLYNTLIRRKGIFKPLRKDLVGLYTCGPTVYNYAHIGNLRTYIFEDILRRTLEYAGYKVRQVMNITDVEDKIIRDAKKAGVSIFEFVKPYEKAFFQDLQKLNIEKAWKYPKATDHIKGMIALVRALLKKGLAYQSGGSVYFDISTFRNYGRLSRLTGRTIKVGARVDADEYEKEDAQDFVLWKESKPGEPVWHAPIGPGRPGWHIECSAMSMQYLGPTFDIHAGGVDLIFPHHENEIAQSEGATGKRFAGFFMEGEHLLVEGQKMAKSLGNFFTLRDIESRSWSPLAFRYLCLTAHYRSKLNFTWKSLAAAQNSLERLYEFIRGLKESQNVPSSASRMFQAKLGTYKKRFEHAIANDLDTPKALALVWDLIRAYNKAPEKFHSGEALELLYDFDRALGLSIRGIKKETIPARIRRLAALREKYRAEKEWQKADQIREQIRKAGYYIKDSSSGPQVMRK